LILTEEELRKYEKLKNQYQSLGFTDSTDLIDSHRNLLSANAELSFKNDRLAKGMVEVYFRSVGNQLSISSYAKYVLEENGYDTSRLPIE
jgi:hypothetical protein